MRINRPNDRTVTSTGPWMIALVVLMVAVGACGTASESAEETQTPATVTVAETDAGAAAAADTGAGETRGAGATSASTSESQPDELAFGEPAEPTTTTAEVTTTTRAPTTTTTAPAAIELTTVEIMDLHNYGWVASSPEAEAEFKRQVLEAFASQDLDWASDTINLHQNEETWGDDGSASTLFLAAAETTDGVAHASVTEYVSTGYFRDGVDVGQEGHTCVFWDVCPAGVTVDDYEFRPTADIEIGNIESSVGSCVLPQAWDTVISADCQ